MLISSLYFIFVAQVAFADHKPVAQLDLLDPVGRSKEECELKRQK